MFRDAKVSFAVKERGGEIERKWCIGTSHHAQIIYLLRFSKLGKKGTME